MRAFSSCVVVVVAVTLGAGVAEAQLATLHKDTRRSGATFDLSFDIADLGASGFDNAASSITLRSNRPIAVYQDTYWRGRCLTVRGNVERLSDVGFGNDNISSARVDWTCEGGPFEVDACPANPCGGGFACRDLPRPAPNAWDGRTCERLPGQPVSLATGKPARQSSTAFGGEAARAVDGRTDGIWAAGSITSTAAEAGWLEIDLGAATEIASVVLHNRIDCCPDRLVGAFVELTDAPCDRTKVETSAPVTTAAASHTFPFSPPRRARYVCVRQPSAKILSLAEVEVFGPNPELTPTPVGLGILDRKACAIDAIPILDTDGVIRCRRATEVKTLTAGTKVVIAATAPVDRTGPKAPRLVHSTVPQGPSVFLVPVDAGTAFEVLPGFVPGTVRLAMGARRELSFASVYWNAVLTDPGDLFRTRFDVGAGGAQVVVFELVRPLAPHPGNPNTPPPFVACVRPVIGPQAGLMATTDMGLDVESIDRCDLRTQFRFFQLAD